MRGAKSGLQTVDGHEWIQLPQLHPDERVSIYNSFLERGIASGQLEGRRSAFLTQLARSALFTNARLALETLSYEWDTSAVWPSTQTYKKYYWTPWDSRIADRSFSLSKS